ncbi:MAG: glutamate--tRNA ligase, partial [Gammaproteobacteria bacterium]
AALTNWSAAAIHAALEASVAALDLKLGKVAQPLRVAVTGGGVSPPIDATVEILGRDATLTRLDRAIAWINARNA